MGKIREEIQLSLTENLTKVLLLQNNFFQLGCKWIFLIQDKIVSNVTFCLMALLRRGNNKINATSFIQELGD